MRYGIRSPVRPSHPGGKIPPFIVPRVVTRNLRPFRHFSLRPDVLFGVFFQDRRFRKEAAPTVSVCRMAFPVTLTPFGAPTFSAVPALFGLRLKSSAETGRPRGEENADLTANPRRANPESARNSGSPAGISEHLTAVPFTDNRTRPASGSFLRFSLLPAKRLGPYPYRPEPFLPTDRTIAVRRKRGKEFDIPFPPLQSVADRRYFVYCVVPTIPFSPRYCVILPYTAIFFR